MPEVVGFKSNPKPCYWEPWEESITKSHAWAQVMNEHEAPDWALTETETGGSLTIAFEGYTGWISYDVRRSVLAVIDITPPIEATKIRFKATTTTTGANAWIQIAVRGDGLNQGINIYNETGEIREVTLNKSGVTRIDIDAGAGIGCSVSANIEWIDFV